MHVHVQEQGEVRGGILADEMGMGKVGIGVVCISRWLSHMVIIFNFIF